MTQVDRGPTITKDSANGFHFKPYRKTTETLISNELLPVGQTVDTLEGEFTCREVSRLAIDAAGNPYPVAESIFQRSYVTAEKATLEVGDSPDPRHKTLVPAPIGELATWKSHKFVKAGQILEIRTLEPTDPSVVDEHANAFELDLVPAGVEYERITNPAKIRVSKHWANRHRPQPRGFVVIYEDGYISYSPSEAFLSGYDISPGRVFRTIDSHVVNPVNDALKIGVFDPPGSGGAPHHYKIVGFKGRGGEVDLVFQNGPIAEQGVNGITHEVLLAILIDRLQCFQKGPYACRDNAVALTKFEEGQMWLQRRTLERIRRGVEDTMLK